MTAAILCGTGGSVTGPTGVTEAHYWEVERSVDVQDVTTMKAAHTGWRDRKACLTQCSGTMRTYTNPEIPDGATVAVTMLTGAGGMTIGGNAYVSSTRITTPVDGKVEYELALQFTGAITVTLT